MNTTNPDSEMGSDRDAGMPGSHLPPGRMDELRPRLKALMVDFAELDALESSDLEPLPMVQIGEEWHDAGD